MKSLAQQIHDARAVYMGIESEIEDTFDEFWKSVDHITTDYHDNSIEVYFEDRVVDLEPSGSELTKVWEWGFDRFWLNFKGGVLRGGTERLYLSPKLQARVAERNQAKAGAA